MTQARRELVSLEATPYYHCISRCVRRAFLCGEDRVSGRSFEHRRQWIVERVKRLAGIFAVDVCAYAVMSNHYHLVLRLRPERAREWSDEEVLKRWSELFSGPLLVRRFLCGARLGKAELQRVSRFAGTYRERLGDLSWFMRCLNKSIAVRPMPRTAARVGSGKGGSRPRPCWMRRRCSPVWPMWISTRFGRGLRTRRRARSSRRFRSGFRPGGMTLRRWHRFWRKPRKRWTPCRSV